MISPTMFKYFFLNSLSICVITITSTYADSTIVEALQSVPDGFALRGPAQSDMILDLRISLASRNISGLESEVYAVSDPASSRYGQYLSNEDVQAFIKPSEQTLQLVSSWLADSEIQATFASETMDWMQLSVSVKAANKLFNANFSFFTRIIDGHTSIQTLSYAIPSFLKEHINVVHPTVAFPMPTKKDTILMTPLPLERKTRDVSIRSDAVPSLCEFQVTPNCLQAFYNIPVAMARDASNTIAVAGFNDRIPSLADLKLFLTNLRPDLPPNTTIDILRIDNGTTTIGVEANLNTQYTVGIASGVPATFIVSSNDTIGDFMGIVTVIASMTRPPNVLTTSFGFNEPSISPSLAIVLCNAYMQLAARGITTLFESGDGGVAGIEPQSCTTFVPTFPSTCPFVTSVGSTTSINETAASYSAGGFSNIFAAPSFQAPFTNAYIEAHGNSNSGKYNKTGRGFPDVSTQGNFIAFFFEKTELLSNGTGGSTSIFGSIVALLNDQLTQNGRPTLGFLNPFLYSSAGTSAFNDITTGNNPGCNTLGFSASPGWDPVTGLGTPNYTKILQALGL